MPQIATELKKKDIFDGMIGKIPPQNIEAEMSILGGILIENSAINKIIEILDVDGNDFYRDSHKKIFKAMIELTEKNEPVDLITITEILSNKNQLEEIGSVAYLSSLVDYVSTAANIEYYAKIVKEKSLLRSMINAATEIITSGYSEVQNIDEFIDKSEKSIFEISESKVRPSFYSIREIVKDSFKTIENLYEKKQLVTGVPTGFKDFDSITSGLQSSDLIIIAGRPTMGKTSFALNIAQSSAINAKIHVALFSLEMSKEQLVMRMLCSEAKVDGSRLRKGYLSERDWPKLTRAAGALSDAPIFIDDSPSITVLEIRAKSRRLKAEYNLGLIIVDYLQLVRPLRSSDTREQEISEISRSLKALAKELRVPVMALSQLSRKVEQRQGNRPQLADLRESGAIEQDADLIAFIYREEVYNPNTTNKGIAEVIIGKQRNGPTGVVKLAFISEYTKFEDLAAGLDDITSTDGPF